MVLLSGLYQVPLLSWLGHYGLWFRLVAGLLPIQHLKRKTVLWRISSKISPLPSLLRFCPGSTTFVVFLLLLLKARRYIHCFRMAQDLDDQPSSSYCLPTGDASSEILTFRGIDDVIVTSFAKISENNLLKFQLCQCQNDIITVLSIADATTGECKP